MTQKKIGRNTSTEAGRRFWDGVEQTAKEVDTWPDWKRAGINVVQVLDEPREAPAREAGSFGPGETKDL